jgi:hypothetical protein
MHFISCTIGTTLYKFGTESNFQRNEVTICSLFVCIHFKRSADDDQYVIEIFRDPDKEIVILSMTLSVDG